jgi:hypothetical protein
MSETGQGKTGRQQRRWRVLAATAAPLARLALAALLVLQAGVASAQNKNQGSWRFWFGPLSGQRDASDAVTVSSHYKQLFTTANWTNTRARTDYFLFYIDDLQSFSAQELQNIVTFLRNNNVKIAVEVGGLRPTFREVGCGAGAGTRLANLYELQKLRPIYQAGGTISLLKLDSPNYFHVLGCGSTPPAQVGDELANYITAIWEGLDRNIRFAWNEPLPFYSLVDGATTYPSNAGLPHLGEFSNIFGTIIGRLRTRLGNADNLLLFKPDQPFEYCESLGADRLGYKKLVSSQKLIKSYGIRFSLLVMSDPTVSVPGYPSYGNNASMTAQQKAAEFYRRSMNLWHHYFAVGGNPDDVMAQDFHVVPDPVSLTHPETTPYTYANFALELSTRVRDMLNPVDYNTLRFYRSLSPSTGDHGLAFQRLQSHNYLPASYGIETPLFKAFQSSSSAGGITVPLYVCELGTEEFVSTLANCEGQTVISSTPVGYVRGYQGANEVPVNRCLITGVGEHFMSTSPTCEGQTREATLGYAPLP